MSTTDNDLDPNHEDFEGHPAIGMEYESRWFPGHWIPRAIDEATNYLLVSIYWEHGDNPFTETWELDVTRGGFYHGFRSDYYKRGCNPNGTPRNEQTVPA